MMSAPDSEVRSEPEADLSAEDFARLLEQYNNQKLAEGEVVRGRIIKILENEVIVDIGYKSEGTIAIQEFRGADGGNIARVGDEVDVLIEKTEDSDGYIVLSKEKAEKMKVWDEVERAYTEGRVVLGRVIERIKGGLAVDIGVRAFLPGSLVDVRPVRNLDALRGKEFRMRVIKVNKRRGNIVLSRKVVLEEENVEKKRRTLESLEEGKRLRGTIKNITDYGAFVDLGGIDGLLHITDMSWGRINHPSELFNVGDELDVVVLKFDRERERVSLGYKQAQMDPWDRAADHYPPYSRVKGKVVSLTDYGAFIELEPGIEGLIHVSEMSWTKRVKHPSKILNVGDMVETVVLDLDQGARRLSLGLKQTEPNPWDLVESKYRIGDKITGKVRNLTDFGAFVEVEEGIDGLIHISDLSWNKRVKHPSEVLKKGDDVEAIILKIDTENQRLSLGLKQLAPNAYDDFFAIHRVGEILDGRIARLTDFGAFVELEEGVEGLVHVSEISRDRVEKPEDSMAADQPVRVKIIRLEPAEKKIGLSIRAVTDGDDASLLASYSGGSGGGASLGEISASKSSSEETPAPKARKTREKRQPAADTE